MNYRLMLLSSTATLAPENDDGADLDDNILDGDEGDGEEGDEEDDSLTDPDEEDDEPGEGDDPPEPREPTRAQTRVQRLANEAKAEKERADRLDRELAEERRQRTQTPQVSPEETARRRDAHLATLTESGRLEFLLNEERHERRTSQARIEFNAWDASDKAAFQGICARNPAAAKLEKEVEKRLQDHRASGQNASREAVLTFLLGEKALAKTGRAKTEGRRREAEGRERQTARPGNGRGDVPPNGQRRTSEAEARRKRLEGMSI